MQFNITSSGDIQQLKGKSVQQDNQLRLQRKTMDDLSSQLHHLKDDLFKQPSLIKKKTAGRESIATEEKCQTLRSKRRSTVKTKPYGKGTGIPQS